MTTATVIATIIEKKLAPNANSAMQATTAPFAVLMSLVRTLLFATLTSGSVTTMREIIAQYGSDTPTSRSPYQTSIEPVISLTTYSSAFSRRVTVGRRIGVARRR